VGHRTALAVREGGQHGRRYPIWRAAASGRLMRSVFHAELATLLDSVKLTEGVELGHPLRVRRVWRGGRRPANHFSFSRGETQSVITGGLFSPTNLIPSETTAFGVLTPRTPAAALHAPQAGAPAPRDEPTNRLGSSYS
jgi:hypothetical protein